MSVVVSQDSSTTSAAPSADTSSQSAPAAQVAPAAPSASSAPAQAPAPAADTKTSSSKGSLLTQSYGSNAAPDASTPAADTSAAKAGAVPGEAGAPSGGADPKANAQQANEAVPEKYEFKVPEGLDLNDPDRIAFEGVAKGLKLSNDAAQKLVDFQASLESKRLDAEIQAREAQVSQWSEQTMKGLGPNANVQLQFAERAIAKFGSKELRSLFDDTGIGSHPEMVKFAIMVGKSLSEDGAAAPTPTPSKPKSDAQLFYPDMYRASQ